MFQSFRTFVFRRSALLVLLLPLAAGSGCGEQQFGTVQGRVLIDGKPVNNGTVIFSGGDNMSAAGVIKPDGRYEATNVPVGQVKVVFQQMMMLGGGPDKPGQLKGLPEPVSTVAHPMPIPKKYRTWTLAG